VLLEITRKMLGDAGEHFAVSQFSFASRPAMKMPDGWKAYDLAVESGSALVRVSVKTRSETEGWAKSKWFSFDERRDCDWLVFVFHQRVGVVRAWVMPFAIARQFGNVAGPTRKDPHMRDVSWAKLNREPLSRYENNWTLAP